MKKFRILLLMIAVVFSLTGCGKKSGLPYEYNEQDLVDNAKNTFVSMLNLSEAEQKYYVAEGDEMISQAVAGLMTAYEEAGAYVSLKDIVVTEGKDSIEVVLLCAFENNDVEVIFIYEADGAYEYKEVYENQGYSVLPYVATEITVQSVYSMSYYMEQAALNTIMGMATVFAVLIFISFIISLFKYIPMIMNKREEKAKAKKAAAQKEETVSELTSAPVVAVAPDENLMNDSELVAVITAAIYAASGSQNGTSKDTLIVRSISRARR